MSARAADGRGSRPRWLVAGLAVVLAAATVASYLPVLSNEFVDFDDMALVRVPQVAQGLTRDGLVWAFTSVEVSNWVPVTRLSWLLDAELFGMDPGGFHASSLAIHVVNALLVLAAWLRYGGALWAAAFVAFVFALHPFQVEAVAWVSSRRDLLSGFFFLLVLLAHERRVHGGSPRRWGALVAVLFALGLMAKPILVTLPFVLLLLDVWPLRRWQPGAPLATSWALVREKLPLFGLALAAVLITLSTQQTAMAPTGVFPLPMRLLNAGLSLFDYLERTLWPADLAVLYPVSRDVSRNRVIVAFSALAIASVFALRELRHRPAYFVGWFGFVGMLTPVLGLLQAGVQASADRYMYLPLLALSVVAVQAVRDALAALPSAARGAAGALVAAAAVASCLALAATTWRQVGYWRDGVAVFERALEVTRKNTWAHHFLGIALENRGEFERAVHHHERALELLPHDDRMKEALARARSSLAGR